MELETVRAENEELKKKYDHTIEALRAVKA
jgi:hypothetical protein